MQHQPPGLERDGAVGYLQCALRVLLDHQRRDALVGQSVQQLDAGLSGVAVALLDRKGCCRGAVGTTMSMTAHRHSERVLEAVLPPQQEAAQALWALW